jgi:hypothetical protein
MRRASLIAIAAAALLQFAAATPQKAREPFKIRIPVRPQNGAGTLRARDFTVTLNGDKVKVVGARTPHDEQIILLVLDLSETLAEAEAAKEALTESIHHLPAHTYVAVLRAQDGPTVLADPTTDRDVLTGAINATPVTGRAALLDTLDAIESLADSITDASGVRAAVLYVTDSDVRNYREDLTNPIVNSSDPHDLSRRFPEALVEEKIDKMAAMMAVRSTPLFIVHLKYRQSKLNAAYQSGLKTLADALGGSSYFCASIAEIPSAMNAAFSMIGSEYLVTVTTAKRLPSAFPVRLEADGAFLIHRGRLVLPRR